MANIAESVLAEGIVYFDTLLSGNYQGLTRMPGPAKFQTKPNSTLVEATTKEKGKYGQVVATAAVPKPADLSLGFSSISPASLAIALQGDVAPYSQGSGTVPDKSLTAKTGTWLELGKKNVEEAGFAVKNAGGTTTYALGADYTVNYAAGLLYIVPGGAIADASAIHASFGYSAISGSLITMGTTAQVRARILFDGRNLFDQVPLQLEVFEAVLTSDSALDWLSDKPIDLSLKGFMVVPDGKPGPMQVLYGMDFS